MMTVGCLSTNSVNGREGQQHRQNGDDDGQHHDGEFLHHAYGRDD